MPAKASDTEKEIGYSGKNISNREEVEFAAAHDAAVQGQLATDE